MGELSSSTTRARPSQRQRRNQRRSVRGLLGALPHPGASRHRKRNELGSQSSGCSMSTLADPEIAPEARCHPAESAAGGVGEAGEVVVIADRDSMALRRS